MYVFNTMQNTKLTPDQVLQEFYARRLRKDGLQQTKDLREFSSHQQTCIRPDNFLIVPMKRQGVEDCWRPLCGLDSTGRSHVFATGTCIQWLWRPSCWASGQCHHYPVIRWARESIFSDLAGHPFYRHSWSEVSVCTRLASFHPQMWFQGPRQIASEHCKPGIWILYQLGKHGGRLNKGGPENPKAKRKQTILSNTDNWFISFSPLASFFLEDEHYGRIHCKFHFSPPARWGLLDFIRVVLLG